MNKSTAVFLTFIAIVVITSVFFLFRPTKSVEPQSTPEPTLTALPIEEDTPMNENIPKKLQQPELTIDQNKTYTAVLKTSEGDITIALLADKTPITVNNFVYLARQNFYQNTIFHRVIDGFMIQGGDPTGTGSGGPGYHFDDEPFDGKYVRGTVAMANAGPNTNGSQFFIVHQNNDLPAKYVIFGQVTEGLDVLDKIATAKVGPNMGGEQSKPVNPVVISSVEITEN
jgi:cyclophilin family peptidyl-prolyl cis-trans isomerase